MLYPPVQHQEQLCHTKNSPYLTTRKNLCIPCEYYIVKSLKANFNRYWPTGIPKEMLHVYPMWLDWVCNSSRNQTELIGISQ